METQLNRRLYNYFFLIVIVGSQTSSQTKISQFHLTYQTTNGRNLKKMYQSNKIIIIYQAIRV
jgi:hypothetical protein